MTKSIKKTIYIFMTFIMTFLYTNVSAATTGSYVGFDEAYGSNYQPGGNNECSRPKGSRATDVFGYRVSLVQDDDETGKRTTIAVYDKVYNSSVRNLMSLTNKLGYTPKNNYAINGDYNISFGKPVVKSPAIDYSPVTNEIDNIIKKADDKYNQIKNSSIEEFAEKFPKTKYYKLIVELASIKGEDTKQKYLCSKDPRVDINGNCTGDSKKFFKYLKRINRTFIMIEPIVTVREGDPNSWYLGKALCKEDKAKIDNWTSKWNIDEVLSWLGVTWNYVCSSCTNETTTSNIGNCMNLCKQGAGQQYFEVIKTLKNKLSSTNYVYYTDTVTNLAKKSYTNITTEINWNALADYLHGNTNDTAFSKFNTVSPTGGGSRDLIKNDSYAYGVNIIHLNFDSMIKREFCDLDENNEIIGPPEFTDNPDYCCEPSDHWKDFNSKTKTSELNEKWKKGPQYQEYVSSGKCPKTTNYCDESHYKDIVENKKNIYTTKISINGKADPLYLSYCCDLDAYKKSDGTYTLNSTQIQAFDEINGKKSLAICYPNACTYREYSAIIESGKTMETTPGRAPILDQNLPFLIDGKQYTYDYCCAPGGDAEAGFSHYDLVNKKIVGTKIDKNGNKKEVSIKKSSFKKNLVNQYCVTNTPCKTSDMERLIELNTLYKKNDPSTTMKTITAEKVLVNGQETSILSCCYLKNYGDNAKQTTINNYNSSKLNPPNFVKVDNEYVLKYADAICPVNQANACTYNTSLAQNKVKIFVNGKERDCCLWKEYGDTDDERQKNSGFTSEAEFKADEKYKSLCSDVCKWNGSNTQAKQIVNGKEIDCCLYKNYGEDEKTKLKSFKTDETPYGVSNQEDLEKTTWFKQQLACNSNNNACTIAKMNADIETYKQCCRNTSLDNFSLQTDKDIIKNAGGLTNYLITMDYEKYFEYCPIDCEPGDPSCDVGCVYRIHSDCPNCSDSSHFSGETKDIVAGVNVEYDTTKIDVPDPVLYCIVENDVDGDTWDSYFYEDLGSEYCPVFCTQKVEYDYPKKSSLAVRGGRYIPTSAINPKINTTLTCRIKEVNLAQFEIDLAAAKEELDKAYEAYSHAKVALTDNKIETHNEDGEDGDCDCLSENDKTLGSITTKCCATKLSETITDKNNSAIVTTTNTYTDKPLNKCSYTKDTCPSGKWVDEYVEVASKDKNESISQADCTSEKQPGYDRVAYSTRYGYCVLETHKVVAAHCSVTYDCCNDTDYTPSGSSCVYNKTSGKDCKRENGSYVCNVYSCASTNSYLNSSETGYLSSSKTGEINDPSCTYEYCSKRDYTRYTSQTVKDYYYAIDGLIHQGSQDDKTCSNNDDYYYKVYKKEETDTKERLKRAIDNYRNIIENLNKCFKVDQEMLEYSDYEVKVSLEYLNGEDGDPYYIETELVYGDPNNSNASGIEIGTTNNFEYEPYSFEGYNIPLDWFGGSKLTSKTETIDKAFAGRNRKNVIDKIYSVVAVRNFSFKLPDDDVYKYVNKDSFSIQNLVEKNINSVALPPHLPVAFNNKDREVIVKLNAEFEGGIIKPSFEEGLCTDEYVCNSEYEKPCVEPVYRPISLTNPFPDENGSGRLTGTNWCDSNGSCDGKIYDDGKAKNEKINTVILNNRGVKSNAIYNLTPLYTIELTPSRISKIRDYNNGTTYGDYNLVCDGTSGRRCKSVYLRGGLNVEGTSIVTDDLTSMGAVKLDRSCALNKNLSGCALGDFYEEG